MSEKFLYNQIYNGILEKIENGEWKRGDLIPKEKELLSIFKVSRDTLRKALDKLKREGVLYSKSGTGTYIKDKKLDYKLSSIESFSEIARREGKTPRSIVFRAEKIIPDKNISKEMQISENEKVYFVERLRLSEDKVVCYENTYINAELCDGIDKYISPNTSLFDLYENKYNIKIGYGKYSLEAVNADAKLSKILLVKDGDAILVMHATIFTEDNIPLYTVIAYYIGSEYIFSAVLPRNSVY